MIGAAASRSHTTQKGEAHVGRPRYLPQWHPAFPHRRHRRATLPLVLGVALMLGGGEERAWVMIVVSLILLFLVFWATHCAEDVVNKMQAARPDRP